MSGLSWTFTINDKMSGPASAILSRLEAVRGSLASVDKSIGRTEAVMSKSSKSFAAMANGLANTDSGIAKTGASAGGVVGSILDTTGRVIAAMSLGVSPVTLALSSISQAAPAAFDGIMRLPKAIGAVRAGVANGLNPVSAAICGISEVSPKAADSIMKFGHDILRSGENTNWTGVAIGTMLRKLAGTSVVGKSASKEISGIASAAKTGGSALVSMGTTAITGAAAVASAVVASCVAIVAAVAAVGYAIGNATFEFSRFVVETGRARENSLIAFDTITKSSSNSSWMLGDASRSAIRTGQTVEQVTRQFQELHRAGLDWYKIQSASEAMAAANAATNSDAAGASIAAAINQISYSGKFDTRSFKSLSQAGIAEEEVFATIAKNLGKSVKEVETMAKTGTSKASASIDGIIDTVQTKYAGALTAKAGGMDAAINALVDLPSQMMSRAFEASKDGLSGVTGLYNGIAATFRSVVGAIFDDKGGLTTTGTRVVSAVNAVADSIHSVFKSIGKLAGGKDPGEIFDRLLTKFEEIWPYIDAFARGFGQGIFDSL
ncbi:MAG: hypothetical protein FWD57_06040, partial [Polyangiaceae bacterium]|nr:hypothetical protein [Polyangiaceae bacterium]